MNGYAVLVTGAAGGVGRALCYEFREAGYFVLATDLESNAPHMLSHAYVSCELGRFSKDQLYASNFRKLVLEILDSHNLQLKVMVNNAAVQLPGGASNVSRSDWEQSLAVNLTAPLFLVQGFLDRLEIAQGIVVNVGSVHAQLTKPNFVAYATSKSALSGLTRSLSVDLGDRIRIIGIEPAAIDTPMLDAGFAGKEESKHLLAGHHPQNRIGTPEELARLVVLLSGSGIDFLHGSTISMDGGISNRLHDPT